MLAFGSCKVDKDPTLCPQYQAGIRQNRQKCSEPLYWMVDESFPSVGRQPGVGILDPTAVSVLSLSILVSQEPLQAASGW